MLQKYKLFQTKSVQGGFTFTYMLLQNLALPNRHMLPVDAAEEAEPLSTQPNVEGVKLLCLCLVLSDRQV